MSFTSTLPTGTLLLRLSGTGLLSLLEAGSRLAESVPVGAWVGVSFFADLDFLLGVLLVRSTGLASSSSRLSDWLGVASSTSNAAKAFAVCVGVGGV